ncbi:C6 transcription factor RegA [Plectosphaerella plurivora]|uniref:C6 transcription factor RegA n=1 Tax=Plectosphaerella plurivora TaxID=936078 RepID=A0A9P8VHM9_9PEZI|nr:C6 transcription factor RegA [Plectosphaerella plurivora]
MAGGPPSLSNLLHHMQPPSTQPGAATYYGQPGHLQRTGLPLAYSGTQPGLGFTPSENPAHPAPPPPEEVAGTASSHPSGGTVKPDPSSQSGGTAATTGTGLYQCAHCQKRYSRPEHLARHIQTHTLGKRFICSICSKAFARQDLLKRHTANHENDNDPNKKRRRIASSPSAARVSHACKACAAARVKCEDTKPCARCRNRGLTCEYSATEAGSSVALHLMHLASEGNSGASTPATPPVQDMSLGTPPYPPSQVSPMPLATPDVVDRPVSRGLHAAAASNNLQAFNSNSMPGTSTPAPAASYAAPSNPGGMAPVPFTGFLQNVLYQPGVEPAKTDAAQGGLAVLDFGAHVDLNLNDVDFDLLGYWNADFHTDSAMQQAYTPRTDDSVDLTEMRQNLVKLWTDSPWRWHPATGEGSYAELKNVPVPSGDATGALRESRKKLGRTVPDKLEQPGRDGALAVILKTCEELEVMTRVASSFPSVDMMDSLIHIFLAAHFCQTTQFIHQATFKLNSQWPDWLAVTAASGAILTPVPTLRKWGFAIQEAVRLFLPKRFEKSNTAIQELGLVQTLCMWLEIALWSGNRRKMEIAECHLAIPVTMMRYRNRFVRSSYPQIDVYPGDTGTTLDKKWRDWCERESWKRLIFSCMVRDGQASMATLINPSMSYAELTLPLPEARNLWFAKTAEEWKAQYMEKIATRSKRPPSVGDLLRDINLLAVNKSRLDVQFAVSIYLHSFWFVIREYQQLSSVLRSRSWLATTGSPGDQVLRSRHAELCNDLHSFQRLVSDWGPELLSGKEHLMTHLILMNLHLSLDDLQLFSGKEGEEQARRMFTNLRDWAQSANGRQALWHAGQVLRQAKTFPLGHLNDFYAVAVHHAALAIWAYGVVGKAAGKPPVHLLAQETVYLDGTVSGALNHFIGYGQGRAAIRDLEITDQAGTAEASVDDTKACMDIAQRILRANFKGRKEVPPPIVENMCGLLKQLGDAAWAVGLG